VQVESGTEENEFIPPKNHLALEIFLNTGDRIHKMQADKKKLQPIACALTLTEFGSLQTGNAQFLASLH
jgi:hypothetical protein